MCELLRISHKFLQTCTELNQKLGNLPLSHDLDNTCIYIICMYIIKLDSIANYGVLDLRCTLGRILKCCVAGPSVIYKIHDVGFNPTFHPLAMPCTHDKQFK